LRLRVFKETFRSFLWKKEAEIDRIVAAHQITRRALLDQLVPLQAESAEEQDRLNSLRQEHQEARRATALTREQFADYKRQCDLKLTILDEKHAKLIQMLNKADDEGQPSVSPRPKRQGLRPRVSRQKPVDTYHDSDMDELSSPDILPIELGPELGERMKELARRRDSTSTDGSNDLSDDSKKKRTTKKKHHPDRTDRTDRTRNLYAKRT